MLLKNKLSSGKNQLKIRSNYFDKYKATGLEEYQVIIEEKVLLSRTDAFLDFFYFSRNDIANLF